MKSIIKDQNNNPIKLTAKEMEVYEILKNDPYAFRSSTATEIASKYNISQSAISRFCQKLGFSGFSDFRLSLVFNAPRPTNNNAYDINHYTNVLNSLCSMIGSTISQDLLKEVANKIINARCCYTSGYGASNVTANMLAFQCMVQGTHVYHLSPSTEVETLHILNDEDVVILYSAMNSSHKDFFDMLEDLPPQKRPYIILVANTPRHPFAKKVDKIILLPNTKDVEETILFTPSISQTIFTFLLTAQVSLAMINKNSTK